MVKDKEKIINIIRNILAVSLIFLGFIVLFVYFIIGLSIILLGVTISPLLYEKTKLNNIKYVQVLLPIGAFNFLILSFVIVALFFSGVPENTIEDNQEKAEVVETINSDNQEEIKKVEITQMIFNESYIELDVKNTKELVLEIFPGNADLENIDGIEFVVSDDKIINLEKISSENNKVKVILKPVSEGQCEVFAKSKNDITSNKIEVKVSDFERIKAEEREKEEEERLKKEAEEQAKREEENLNKEKSSDEQVGSTASQNKKSSSNANNSHGKAIYVTPNGKRYHYDPDCGGKNSTRVSLEDAKNRGYTPCQKCVH